MEDLYNILVNFKKVNKEWNVAQKYNAVDVMKKFEVFLNPLNYFNNFNTWIQNKR